MKYKEIPLLPTQFMLDFWQFDSKEQAIYEFSKRYGASEEYYKDWITENQVSVITSTVESPAKGDQKIVMNVTEIIDLVIVHEIIHIIFKLNKLCHVEINQKSQEWMAYMAEYIFNEISKIKEEQK